MYPDYPPPGPYEPPQGVYCDEHRRGLEEERYQPPARSGRWAFWTLVIIVVAAAILLAGCSTEHRQTACGPRALSAVYAEQGVVIPAEAIRREIAAAGPDVRDVLGIVAPKVRCITWPGEIVANARAHGFTVCEVGGGDPGLWAWAGHGRGILLVQHRTRLWMHYLACPVSAEALKDYGECRAVRGWEIRR